MWGQHLILDLTACDREVVSSRARLTKFVGELVDAIGMRAHGEPILEHFATHDPDAAGFSLVQLIETSAITGHFVDRNGDSYLDIFSCKEFSVDVALGVVRAHLAPRNISSTLLFRQAQP
jgi:S-adenosylmethionine/arginine decarboxylase-like enzyme